MLLKHRKGTTIIEVVVSLVLIGLFLLWTWQLYFNVAGGSVSTANMEVASHLASDRVEYLKTLSETDIDAITTTSVTAFPVPYEDYGYKYVVPATVNGVPNPSDNGKVYLKYIEVEVFLMKNTTKPLISVWCNFLRKDSDGSNAGL